MLLRSNILFLLVVFNILPLFAVYRAVNVWVQPTSRRRKVLLAAGLAIFLLNAPISLLWARSVYEHLYDLPSSTLRVIFYPALAWQTTALLFTLILGPAYAFWAAGKVARRVVVGGASHAKTEAPAISRRSFLTRGAGLLVPAIYGVSSCKLLQDLGEAEISPEITIPMHHLPRTFEGMTVVQLSDLHVGPYIRRKEVEYWVSLANALRPDLVVLTGDVIDRSLASLPDALEGLRGLRPPLGVLAVLGNHDLSSDRYSARGELRGGETIAQGMESIGIPTLRNQVTYIGSGPDRLAVMGLDWIVRRGSQPSFSAPGSPGFYRYYSAETRAELGRMAEQIPPETPTILLAHHPDTFSDVPALRIGLTLAGHTHGGGQVVFFTWDGAPVGITSARFRYVSGLFQENGCSLYVNRGLGYFGVPIRINCPPEISRFRLVRPPPVS